MPYDIEELLKLGKKGFFITPEANAALGPEEAEPAPKTPPKPTINPIGGVGGSKQSGFNLPKDPEQAQVEHLRMQEDAKRQVLDEELFGVETAQDPNEIAYRRSTGGIFDPAIERRLATEQRAPLRKELEGQQQYLMGEVAAGKGPKYTREAGSGLRKVEDLLKRLEGRPLDDEEQLTQSMELMPQWEARAREVGTATATEELRAEAINQKVHPRVAQDLAHRLAIAGKIYLKDPSHPEALPYTMTHAATERTQKFMAEQAAEAERTQREEAIDRASQPDLLQQLFGSLTAPSGPEAPPAAAPQALPSPSEQGAGFQRTPVGAGELGYDLRGGDFYAGMRLPKRGEIEDLLTSIEYASNPELKERMLAERRARRGG